MYNYVVSTKVQRYVFSSFWIIFYINEKNNICADDMKVILKLSSETMRLKRRGVGRVCVMNFTSGSGKLVNYLHCGDHLKPTAELGSI